MGKESMHRGASLLSGSASGLLSQSRGTQNIAINSSLCPRPIEYMDSDAINAIIQIQYE